MKRPVVTDKKTLKYIEHIEGKLSEFSSLTTKVKSYEALRNFIDQGNRLLRGCNFDGDELNDKEDKAVERGLKFADKMLVYNSNLDELYEMIGSPKDIEKDLNAKEAGSNYEEMLELND